MKEELEGSGAESLVDREANTVLPMAEVLVSVL
jgi:hypothetical protein